MAVGSVLVGISLVPLIRNDNWVFRIFEYPRSQKLALNVFLISLFTAVVGIRSKGDIIFLAILGCNAAYLLYQVWPYTLLGRRQMKNKLLKGSRPDLSLLIFNVYQENKDVQSCLDAIAANRPDLILLVETDDWWKQELDKKLKQHYRFQIAEILNNTYGMVLYSRLELIDPHIRYLVEKDVPSIHTKLKLSDGRLIQMYGLHPKPPVPTENPRSTERDAEILTVAKESVKQNLPVIVAGDLNDVAWSYTTELFLKTSKLLDPRRGRGFFNTFNAHHWYLRWPLDHVFCSSHFELCELRRLPKSGSDHFPMYISLALSKNAEHTQSKESLDADAEDMEIVEEKISEVR